MYVPGEDHNVIIMRKSSESIGPCFHVIQIVVSVGMTLTVHVVNGHGRWEGIGLVYLLIIIAI